MTAAPLLTGSSVVLRPPQPTDGADRLALGNDPDIMRMFGADPAALPPLTQAAVAAWLDGIATCSHAWVVEHDGRLLGGARLHTLDWQDARAQFAVGLYDPARLGIGLGRETVRLVLQHAFGELRLHRVGLRVVAYNVRAIRCYQACVNAS